MTLRALNIAAAEWFEPQVEKGKAPAGFLCRGLDGYQQAEIATFIEISPEGDITFTAVGIRMLFERGLEDWRNITDDNDRQVKYPGAENAQRMLPYNYQVAVAAHIFNLAYVTRDDKKK